MKLVPPPHRLLLAATALVSVTGIFHALPLVNVVADEMYYVGGVFRALAAGSPLPLPGDVPYGTLTFFLNYALQLPFLAALLILGGLDLSSLRELLSMHPEIAYVVPRLASALVAVLFALFYERFLREEGIGMLSRLAAFAVLFLSLLPLAIFHTGKMWVFSFSLAAAALLYAYRALRLRHDTGNPRMRRALLLSLPLASLAAANFLFAGIALLIGPVLFYVFRNSRAARTALVRSSGIAAALFLLALVLNGENMLSLVGLVFTSYHPLDADAAVFQIGFFHSLGLHAYQLLAAFPLALAALLVGFRRKLIGNRLLLTVALGASALYLFALSFLATWYDDPALYFRYSFPFAFLLSMTVAALSWERMRGALAAFLAAHVVTGGFLLLLLATPTTYNAAREYLLGIPSDGTTLLYEDVVEVDLPLDSGSAVLLKDEFCGSRCAYAREHLYAPGGPVSISEQSTSDVPLSGFDRFLVLRGSSVVPVCAGETVATFRSGGPDSALFTVERGIGSYFRPEFWSLQRLGENLVLEEVPAACMRALIERGSRGERYTAF